jgi:hypothetical protein
MSKTAASPNRPFFRGFRPAGVAVAGHDVLGTGTSLAAEGDGDIKKKARFDSGLINLGSRWLPLTEYQ